MAGAKTKMEAASNDAQRKRQDRSISRGRLVDREQATCCFPECPDTVI
jgi:hypothetical protein